jgi:hypothetical protein
MQRQSLEKLMTIDQLTVFFGWCALINIVIMLVAFVCLKIFREMITNIHSNMMGVDKAELPVLYFKYLANYKIAIFVFSLAPYLALRIAF